MQPVGDRSRPFNEHAQEGDHCDDFAEGRTMRPKLMCKLDTAQSGFAANCPIVTPRLAAWWQRLLAAAFVVATAST